MTGRPGARRALYRPAGARIDCSAAPSNTLASPSGPIRRGNGVAGEISVARLAVGCGVVRLRRRLALRLCRRSQVLQQRRHPGGQSRSRPDGGGGRRGDARRFEQPGNQRDDTVVFVDADERTGGYPEQCQPGARVIHRAHRTVARIHHY